MVHRLSILKYKKVILKHVYVQMYYILIMIILIIVLILFEYQSF